MQKAAVGVVASGICTFCAVLIYVGPTGEADAPKAGSAFPISVQPSESNGTLDRIPVLESEKDDTSLRVFELPTQVSSGQGYIDPSSVAPVLSAPMAPMARNESSRIGVSRQASGNTPESAAQSYARPFAPSDMIIMTDDMAVDVPPGAPLPVAVFVSARQPESDDFVSPRQELADRVASDFTRAVVSDSSSALPDNSDNSPVESSGQERWHKAATLADDRFRALLGDEVYNRELIRQHQLHQ